MTEGARLLTDYELGVIRQTLAGYRVDPIRPLQRVYVDDVGALLDHIDALAEQLAAAEARAADQPGAPLRVLRAIHRDHGEGYCEQCTERYPCATISEVEALAADHAELARAAVAYDEAILSCAEDPARMSTYCTAEGDDLDALYFDLMTKARTVVGLPNVLAGHSDGEAVP